MFSLVYKCAIYGEGSLLLLTTGVVGICGKFAAGVTANYLNLGERCDHRCRWYQWCTLIDEYLQEFSNKIQNGDSRIIRGQKMIQEKNHKNLMTLLL